MIPTAESEMKRLLDLSVQQQKEIDRLRIENESLRDRLSGLEAACDSLSADNLSLMQTPNPQLSARRSRPLERPVRPVAST